MEKRGVKNITVIHHGVNTELFDPSKYVQEKENLAIYVGGIEKHDGTLLVPQAAEKILKSFPMRFLFIGKGGALQELKNDVNKKGLACYFDFIDWIEHEQLPGYLVKAKIGLIPQSHTLAKNPASDFSQVLKGLEYLAMELPIVAPNLRGMYEEVGKFNERGAIFECGNADSLANAILFLMTHDSEREIKGKIGRNFILSSYKWSENADKIVGLCEVNAR